VIDTASNLPLWLVLGAVAVVTMLLIWWDWRKG